MINEPPNKTWLVLIVAIIGAAGVIIAAIIGLGEPFAERFADKYMPIISPPSNTIINTPIAANQTIIFSTQSYPTTTQPPDQLSTEELAETYLPEEIEPIGTGVFKMAKYSDGNIAISQDEINAKHNRVEIINPGTTTSGCLTSWFTVDNIWFGSASKTTLFVNDVSLGETYYGNGKHGHIIPVSVNEGDELCVKPIPTGGFHIVLGPDVLYHYASYCYRGNCE